MYAGSGGCEGARVGLVAVMLVVKMAVVSGGKVRMVAVGKSGELVRAVWLTRRVG